MGIELIAIIITGVVSGFDLIVNVFTVCMTGRCKSTCCDCFEFEHEEEPDVPKFKFTESIINKLSKTETK
jgi:hypothetical protein